MSELFKQNIIPTRTLGEIFDVLDDKVEFNRFRTGDHLGKDVLDHIDGSVRNEKIYVGARTYTALVEKPTIREEIFRPNAPGSETNIPGQFPATSAHWDKVNEDPPNEDSTYVFSTTTLYRRDLYNIPAVTFNNPINAVRIRARCRSLNAGFSHELRLIIRTHGVIYESPLYLVSPGVYANIEHGWSVNPFTRDLWTPTEIDNLEIGIGLRVGIAGHEVRCTQVCAIVEAVTNPGKGDYFNIQKAIEAVKNLGGGIVFLRPGMYEQYGDINIYDNISLVGFDREASVINFGPRRAGISIIGDTASYSIGTIAVTSGSTIVTGTGTVWIANVSAGEYIRINDVWYKIKTVDSNTQITLENEYIGNTVSGLSYSIAAFFHGISLKEFTIRSFKPTFQTSLFLRFVKDSFLYHLIIDGARTSVDIGDCSGISLTKNTIRNSDLEACIIRRSLHVKVDFNDFSNTSRFGVTVEGSRYVEIVGNKCLNNGRGGICLTSGERITVANNFIARSWDMYGILIGGITNSVIIGNHIDRMHLVGIYFDTDAGIGSFNIITGNTITNNGWFGIDIPSGSCTNNIITSNQITGNVSGAIRNLGTNTIIANNATDIVEGGSTLIEVTNRSGVTLARGDVVIFDPANDNSVITTTTIGYERGVAVVAIGGAHLARITVIIAGNIPRMWTTAASGTGRGQFLRTSATTRRAELTGTTGGVGDFAVAITNADASGYLAAIFNQPEVF